MLIRFTTTIEDGELGLTYKAGTVLDLPNAKANHYVQSGIATKAAEPANPTRENEVTPGAIKVPDPASQAAADVFAGVTTATMPTPLSSGNPPPEKTTSIPGADTNPAYVGTAHAIPSAGKSDAPKVVDAAGPSSVTPPVTVKETAKSK